MLRRCFFAVAILLFTVTAWGCRTCDNPYDYCGPVVDSGAGSMGFRSGGGMPSTGVAAEEIPTPTSPPAAPSESPGVEPYDVPPSMGETDATSVMRTRLRYAR